MGRKRKKIETAKLMEEEEENCNGKKEEEGRKEEDCENLLQGAEREQVRLKKKKQHTPLFFSLFDTELLFPEAVSHRSEECPKQGSMWEGWSLKTASPRGHLITSYFSTYEKCGPPRELDGHELLSADMQYRQRKSLRLASDLPRQLLSQRRKSQKESEKAILQRGEDCVPPSRRWTNHEEFYENLIDLGWHIW